VPMCLLFFIGVFASYLLVMRREGRKFPWKKVLLVIAGIVVIAALLLYLVVAKYHYHFIQKWPYLVR